MLYLLKHLINISQRRTVEISILVHLEAIHETSRSHFKHCIAHSLKFALNLLVFLGEVAQRTKDVKRLILPAP